MPKYYYKLSNYAGSNTLIITNKKGHRNLYSGVIYLDFKAPEKSVYYKKPHRINNDIVLSMIRNDRYKSNKEIFNMLVKEEFKRIMYAKHSIIIKYEH